MAVQKLNAIEAKSPQDLMEAGAALYEAWGARRWLRFYHQYVAFQAI